jgi:hypothetical protein
MRKLSIVFFALVTLSLLAGCGSAGKATVTIPTATSQIQVPSVQPTQQDQQAVQPTAEPAFTPEPFYTEEFETDAPTGEYYTLFIPDTAYTADDFDWSAQNGVFTMNAKKEGGGAMLIYEAYTYTDVAVTAVVANHGDNTGITSLVCRYVPDQGWYEVIVEPAGLYMFLDWHYENGVIAYDQVYSGGSGKIKPGGATNTYKLTCIDQTMTLYVNGAKAWSQVISSSLPQYSEGYVGFGVWAQDVLPVTFGFDQFIIEQP